MTLLDTALEFARNTQLIAAGLGSVGLASVMYHVRSIPGRVSNVFGRLCTLELSLNSDSALYHEMLAVLSTHRVLAFARNFTTDPDGALAAGYGRSFAVYRGRFLTFERERLDDKVRPLEKLTVRIMARNPAILEAMIAQARGPSDDDKIKVYTSGLGGYWYQPMRKKKRPLDTVFANGDIKSRITDRIEWFRANESWYLKRGIPYKLTILLHGKPGTGKTSLIFAVASHFNMSLGAVNVINDIDHLLRNAPDGAFVAIEDIDMLAVARPAEGKPADAAPSAPAPAPAPVQTAIDQLMGERTPLSALQLLINALDGLATNHGAVVFITTNHKDRLDHALLRQGRIDLDLEVGPLDDAAARGMFEAFYDCVPIHSIGGLTGAEYQTIFAEEADPDHAMQRLGVYPDARGNARLATSA